MTNMSNESIAAIVQSFWLQGKDMIAVADEIGIKHERIRDYLYKLRKKRPELGIPNFSVPPDQRSASMTGYGGMNGDGVEVLRNVLEFPDKKVVEFNKEDWLDICEKQTTLYEKDNPFQRDAIVRIYEDPPVGIFMSSDWHLGHLQCDISGFKRAFKAVCDINKLFILTNGDLSQNFVSHATRHPVFQQAIPPEAQQRLAICMLEDLQSKNKLLGVVASGEHDLRDENIVGESSLKQRFRELKIPVFRNRAFIRLQIGKNKVKCEVPILAIHKSRYGSILNKLHSAAREYQLDIPAHVILTSHRHTPAHSVVSLLDRLHGYTTALSKECNWPVVLGGKAIFIQTGSFQRDDFSYSFWGSDTTGGWPTIAIFYDNPILTDVVTSFNAAKKLLE